MLTLTDITRHYGLRPVLRNISLQIPAGRLTAIIGPNGMGKTTLLKVLAGVLHPHLGSVEIDGHRRRSTPAAELAVRKLVAWLPDHPWVPLERTGREFLIDVALIYDQPLAAAIDHARQLLDLFQLREQGDRPIRSYSNGQKKKISLAGVLATKAAVLLLDEPFAGGLDPAGITALRMVLTHLTHVEGRTIVMTSPAPELVDGLADDFVVLVRGEITAHASLAGLRTKTGCNGSLSEVLQRLLDPELTTHVQAYLEQRS